MKQPLPVKYIQELDERYPTTSCRQKPSRKGRMLSAWKDKQMVGSRGAASEVRHIDPSTVDLSAYGVTQVAKKTIDETPVDLPWRD